MNDLNIKENRAGRKYPLRIQCLRVAWALGRVIFRLVPRPFYGLRRVILRLFGARVGRCVNIANTATIYFPWNLEIRNWSAIGDHACIYSLGKITIADRVTVSQRAHLCAGTHDYSDPMLPLLTPPISIGRQVWICADAFVGPGVDVGEGAVVGACAVVTRNVEPWKVVAGNPARVVKERTLRGNE